MIINTKPSKLSFGAIKLAEISKIKEGTKIKDGATGEEWFVNQKPLIHLAYKGKNDCLVFDLPLRRNCIYRNDTHLNCGDPNYIHRKDIDCSKKMNWQKDGFLKMAFLKFDPNGSPANEDQRFSIVA